MALLWHQGVLGGLLLLAWLSPGLADVAVDAVQAPEEATPAAVVTPGPPESEPSNQTYEEEQDWRGSRGGRFLPWPSPHPTIATFTQRASQLSDILRRAAKFLSAFASTQDEDDASNNEIDVDSTERKDDAAEDESPSAALSGLYTECLLKLSVPCVQRKLLLFLDRLGRMERFRLFGDFLTVVRVEPRNWEGRKFVLDEDTDALDLAAAADRLVDDFFDTHVIRFTLPGTLRVGRAPRTTVDIQLERPGLSEPEHEELESGAVAEGRSVGKFGGGGGGGGNSKKKQKMMKKIKKRLMKVLMMVMSVMMVMGPMMGGMAGNTAGMASMMGMLSLVMLKGMMIRQMGGSVSTLMGNIGNSFNQLAGIPTQNQNPPPPAAPITNYQPTGTGGGPYARSDFNPAYNSYSYGARANGGSSSWLGGFDPMGMAYRAYSAASHLK